MAVAFRAAATSTYPSNSVNKPAGTVDNDEVLALVYVNSTGAAVTSSSGFTSQVSTNGLNGFWKAQVWSRLSASDGATYTWGSGGVDLQPYAASFSGVDPAAPIDGTPTGTSVNATTVTAPTLTAARNGSMSVILCINFDGAVWSSAPAGYSTAANADGLGIFYQAVNAGSIAPPSAGDGATNNKIAIHVILEPPAGAAAKSPPPRRRPYHFFTRRF